MSIRLLLMAIMNAARAVIEWLELDYMEYSSDANAQSAYVTNGTEAVDQQQTTNNDGQALGDSGGVEYREAQGFQLSNTLQVTAVEVGQDTTTGSPTGNWTLRIETNNAGVPSGTLADANASVVVAPPGDGSTVKGTFATPFNLTGSTLYWLVINCDNQSDNQTYRVQSNTAGGYANGTSARSTDGTWASRSPISLYFKIYAGKTLLAFSESTIKTQGSYSLKAVAAATDSLNKTLTKTFSPALDLSGKTQIKFDIRASRTGSNIKLGFHDSGGTTTEVTPNITSADTFQTVTVDISAVADADKDAIDSLIITILNADSANTIYIDNVRYG